MCDNCKTCGRASKVCKVAGCRNRKCQGRFEGDVCKPCFEYAHTLSEDKVEDIGRHLQKDVRESIESDVQAVLNAANRW